MKATIRFRCLWVLPIFLLFFHFSTTAQQRTNCFRVSPDRTGDMPDSIRNNFPNVFLIPDQEIINFLDDQLRQYPEMLPGLEPPAPLFSIYDNQSLNLRWQAIPDTEKPDSFRISILNLEQSQTITPLPADTATGISIPISLGFMYQTQLVSFISIKDNKQSVLDIIIIDKDAAINCESAVIGSGNSLTETPPSNANGDSSPEVFENPSLELFPNPTSDWSVLCFHLPQAGEVHIELFHSMSGRKIATLQSPQHFPGGIHQLYTNSEDLPAGQYTCLLYWNGQVIAEQLFKTAP